MKEQLVFYKEWLRLDKGQFRILAMLADMGEFTGNLSDMCRYFSLTLQTSNKSKLRIAIAELTAAGFINSELKGRTYRLKLIPKAKEIRIPRQWLWTLKAHNYSSENVAWEQVVKVILWICDNKEPVITNDRIATDLNISMSTIGYAKNVLEHEYEAITRRKVSEKIGEDFFRTIGQELQASAWWTG